MPTSYILIFERAPPEIVLYATSNCEQVLGVTPEEMVGTCILDYAHDDHAKHYSCQWPADNPELGVTILPHNVKHRDGHPVFCNTTAINCSGHIFSIVTAYPELGRVDIGESILYKLQYEADFDGERSNASTGSREAEQPKLDDLLHLKHPPITKDSLQKAHVYTARATRAKSCLVLDLESQEEPKVEFVTNSIAHIFDGELDASDIIGMPLFSLVATEDITKAASYVDYLVTTQESKLCALRLQAGPDQEPVRVELFGASSSDKKVVLMCQKTRKSSVGDEAAYMSLNDIVSSDYETTEAGEFWSELF